MNGSNIIYLKKMESRIINLGDHNIFFERLSDVSQIRSRVTSIFLAQNVPRTFLDMFTSSCCRVSTSLFNSPLFDTIYAVSLKAIISVASMLLAVDALSRSTILCAVEIISVVQQNAWSSFSTSSVSLVVYVHVVNAFHLLSVFMICCL